MAAEGGVIVPFIFTGERDEYGQYQIPQNLTHLIIHKSVTVIPAFLFYMHPSIIELICHAGVKVIEEMAFDSCPCLRRLIIPGVEVVEARAFRNCKAVIYVECPKLERIEDCAFHSCKSLSSIDVPSAKTVGGSAFGNCPALTDANFGKSLETIEWGAFYNCQALERIAIPLKNGLFDDSMFIGCIKLKCVELLEREVLYESIDVLLSTDWRDDMNVKVDSINQILLSTLAGDTVDAHDMGEKTQPIQEWIAGILSKIIRYKAQHRCLLNEAAAALELVLPKDVVMDNVKPFLALPSYTFDGEVKVDA